MQGCFSIHTPLSRPKPLGDVDPRRATYSLRGDGDESEGMGVLRVLEFCFVSVVLFMCANNPGSRSGKGGEGCWFGGDVDRSGA